MIARLIGWSARNLMLILISAVFAIGAGIYALAMCRWMPFPISPTRR